MRLTHTQKKLGEKSKVFTDLKNFIPQGLSISTPLNINYQIQALNSLRKGIEEYDRRRGWRGKITNKIKNKNWENTISQYKLDPTLNWKLAEITSLAKDKINFKIIEKQDNIEEVLFFKNLKWSIPKKNQLKMFIKLGI